MALHLTGARPYLLVSQHRTTEKGIAMSEVKYLEEVKQKVNKNFHGITEDSFRDAVQALLSSWRNKEIPGQNSVVMPMVTYFEEMSWNGRAQEVIEFLANKADVSEDAAAKVIQKRAAEVEVDAKRVNNDYGKFRD